MTTTQTPELERDRSRPARSTTSGREALEQVLALMEAGDLEGLGALVTDDFTMEWPQSGERFEGRDDALAALRAQDEMPSPAAEPRVVGGGDTWIMMMPLDYGGEIHHYVGVFELQGGLLQRSTEYFGAPFPPKEARAAYRASD